MATVIINPDNLSRMMASLYHCLLQRGSRDSWPARYHFSVAPDSRVSRSLGREAAAAVLPLRNIEPLGGKMATKDTRQFNCSD
jgi:hypothetical protein